MVVDQSLSCYIRDENTGKFVYFNVEKPESYTDSYTANFQQQDVRGRDNPFQSFINSGPRQISFSVLLALDYRRDLDKQTEAIRKMMKPYKSEAGSLIKAPKVLVKIGKALMIYAIPQSFSAEWTGGYKNGIYRLCTWSFSFSEVSTSPVFNSKTDNKSSKGNIPASLEHFLLTSEEETYLSGGEIEEASGEGKVEVGDTYTLPKGVKAYETANDALNNTGNVTYFMEDREYYVTNKTGDAILLTNGKGGQNIGWVVP